MNNSNATGLPKVLIVDDKPANLLSLETILRDLDIEIIKAESGEAALGAVLRHSFAVVLLDVKMPGMSGLETAQLMQGYDQTVQIPVIFVTGQAIDELDQLDGYATGAADYIIKPINPDILISKVKLFLRLHLQTEELRDKYRETASLELILKDKNQELEKNNTALEKSNRDRQHQYQQTRRLLEQNPDGILVVDHQQAILYANPAAPLLFDRDQQQLQGNHFEHAITVNHSLEINISDGNIVEMSAVDIDWNGEEAFLITLHDITARKHTEAKLIQLAQYDQLTGLANRRHCLDCTKKVLARAKRREGYMAVVFLDLDKFKDINDSLGHDAGDELLKYVADRLRQCIREGDLAARFGGDEFALILDEISNPEDAALVAQKILKAIKAPHALCQKTITVGCSIGIATYPLCGQSPDALFKAADIAMFHAKSKGRNTFQFYADKMQQKLMHRLHLEQDLRHAIDRDELRLHYQPQVDFSSGKIVSLEALLRWQHPSRGLVSPEQFIPVAEKTDLISKFGEWVLRTACQQAQLWNEEFHTRESSILPTLKVAVNVSTKQLSCNDFKQQIKRILIDTGANPQHLELEITESLLMENPEDAVTELASIHGEGIDIAIDDFGTGYSSLNYLQQLPLNALKIDRSFTAQIGENKHSEVIVKTIIGMAHSLNLHVVAEGVETKAQVAFLQQLECDLMQGYFFSKPLPADQITALLQNTILAPHHNTTTLQKYAG